MNATARAIGQFSDDQLAALDALATALDARVRVSVLTGPAGSGKTTLMQQVASMAEERGRDVLYAAPTGKAALRLTQVTGEQANTLHSLLYGQVEEDENGDPVFSGKKRLMSSRTLLIVDEASMVGETLHQEILSQLPDGAALLYVGDREQLPPVTESWGPDFTSPTAALTEIHRQAAGNPIIEISAAVRTGGKLPHGDVGDRYHRGRASIDQVAAWMVAHVEAAEDAVVLSWTHKVRTRVNALVRSSLGHLQPLVAGDRVRVMQNDKILGRMNGEILTVKLVTESGPFLLAVFVDEAGRTTKAHVHPGLIGAKVGEFKAFTRDREEQFLHVDYGYALTVHSSQGSEFRHVAFVIDATTAFLARKDRETARRLVYTAVTRARERLDVFDVGGDR